MINLKKDFRNNYKNMGLEAIFEATKKGLLEEPGVLIKELEAKSK
jgi:hypothetical protein